MSTPGSRRKRDVMTSSSSPHLEYRQRLRNSLSHQRRSSARKSLEFGATPEKKPIDFPVEEEHSVVAAAPSSVNDEDQRVPPIRDFWSSPPPPKPVQEVVGRTVNRYSRRLRTRRLIPQVSDSSSPTQFANNLEPALPKKTVDIHYDQASVFSDYGTASESSSYFQPSSHHASSSHSHIDTAARDKFLHPCNSEQSCTSQSVGYASDLDLDDCMSNLSIDDANRSTQESRHWDSDLEDGKESEWDEDLPSNGLHLNLTDLQLKSLKTFLKTYQGINVLVPLDGYEIFRPQKCVSRSSLRNNQHRGIVRYDLRKRPGRQLETLLTIQVYNHISIESDFLRHGVRIFQVSPIISVQPHNVKFCALYPAIVQIPLKTNPSVGDEVHCLYSRHLTGNLEDNHQKIPWKSVEVGRSCVKNGRAIIETYDFGLFVLIIRPRPLSANKTIRARVGGRLLVHDLPSVEINFPKEATPDDTIKASARIYLDTEESVAEILSRRDLNLRSRNPSKNFKGDEPHSCLATPIIELDPHGIKFNGEPVTVTLPVPDHEKIVSVLGTAAKLSIWQSSTASNEPSCWEKLEVDFKINHTKMNGEPVTLVSFPVRHFSFFKGVWSVIADYLYEAKIGMMFYFVSFPMKCHANMDEFVGTVLTVTNENVSKEKTDVPEDGENSEQKDAVVNERRFGLEINVCQADKPWPPKTLYKHEVGRSNEKLVKPGKITVKLKSHYFEPDVLAGEEELEKEEPDFRGRDFGLQFACKFKPNVNIERGPFGKVLVTRHFSPRQKGQPIFEFNLQKQGNEAEIQPPRSPNDTNNVEWSHVALYEFAQNLFIIEGENWKLFAKEVGMTHQEIRNISWNVSLYM
ncbi:unnamed protein product [Orchesella dallaii]|uniref:Uncharacterized protein n=1 Tax=Orchesella dallaii TaxID=48710 RepID=A0ABP1QCM9_9HEXA